MRPTWELLYSHYVMIKGMDAPWTTSFLNESLKYYKGAEGGAGSWGEGSGHYDGLGWGSLLYHLDESDVAAQRTPAASLAAPSGATTSVVPAQSTNGSIPTTQSSAAKSTSASTTSVTPAGSTTISTPQSSVPSTSSGDPSTAAAPADLQPTLASHQSRQGTPSSHPCTHTREMSCASQLGSRIRGSSCKITSP